MIPLVLLGRFVAFGALLFVKLLEKGAQFVGQRLREEILAIVRLSAWPIFG